MAMQKPAIPKGTRDFGPLEVRRRRHILSTLENVFRKYGFMPLESPAMENLSTLLGKYGDEGDQLLFKILDSGDFMKNVSAVDASSGSAALAQKIASKGLRYDLTVPFARFVAMNRNDIALPFRRYQMQPVWRADRPQKGRYREFWQCDADIVGSRSLLNELDLVLIYDEAFRALGLTDYRIRINHRQLLAGIISTVKGSEWLIPVSVAIDKLDKIGEAEVRQELLDKGFSHDELDKLFDLIAPPADLDLLKEKLASSVEAQQGITDIQKLLERITQMGGEVRLSIDLTLARGLSYYTGCIFEVNSEQGSLRSSIGGGGRYDDLTGNFGVPGIPGVGISFGLDRIYDVMDELKLFPPELRSAATTVLFCCMDEQAFEPALAAIARLRESGISAEVYPDLRKIGKQLDYANALQIPYVCIIGEAERTAGNMLLKNMTTGEQKPVTAKELLASLPPAT
jgi:histidyl-tRNA synthetase